MKKDKGLSNVWAAVLLASLLLVAPAWPAGQQDIATWRASPGGMDWSFLVPENGSVLTIGGGEVHFRKVFEAGHRPRFSPSDIEGSLPDGTYQWELRIVPRGVEPLDESGLNNGRPGDREGPPQAPARSRIQRQTGQVETVQSGSFTVLNGGIIDPGMAEPGNRPNSGAEGAQ